MRLTQDQRNTLALSVHCPHCDAKPGEDCENTLDGLPHSSRQYRGLCVAAAPRKEAHGQDD